MLFQNIIFNFFIFFFHKKKIVTNFLCECIIDFLYAQNGSKSYFMGACTVHTQNNDNNLNIITFHLYAPPPPSNSSCRGARKRINFRAFFAARNALQKKFIERLKVTEEAKRPAAFRRLKKITHYCAAAPPHTKFSTSHKQALIFFFYFHSIRICRLCNKIVCVLWLRTNLIIFVNLCVITKELKRPPVYILF